MKALKAAAEAKDVEKCKSLTAELEKMLGELNAAAQQAAAQQGAPTPDAAPNDGPRQAKGKVVDAEVVDDDNK